MTIAVELLFVFVLSHLLSAFLDYTSHDLPSFLFQSSRLRRELSRMAKAFSYRLYILL
jgi:hypothetical protein